MGEVTRAEAMKDFRYADSTEAVIEAYQITEHTLFDEKGWPPWLHMQKNKGQQNVLYRDMASPMSLYINMSGTEGQLGLNAWIIVGDDGSLSVMGELEFGQYYNKVVPIPEVVPMEPSDGQTDQEFYDGLDPKTIEKLGLTDPSTRKPAPPPIVEVAKPMVDVAEHFDKIVVGAEILELRAAMLDAMVHLKGSTSKAATKATLRLEVGLETAHEGGLKWCECSPGSCDEVSKWGCRKSSPLL